MSTEIKSNYKSRALGILFSMVLLLTLTAIVEIGGWGYLKFTERETYPLFIKTPEAMEAEGIFDRIISHSYLDPHLGHAHNLELLQEEMQEAQPGFVCYGASEDEAEYTIVTLGGSTTDPTYVHAWPSTLAKLLNENGMHVRVLNGGVAGYSSNQELLKLVRDVLPLEPDMVISLNGVNDLGFLHSATNHPMVHPYQKSVLSAIAKNNDTTTWLLPNAVAAVLTSTSPQSEIGINLGTVVRRKDYEQWHTNVRIMHAVSAEFGVPYLCFLQPVMGAEDQPLLPIDQAMLDETIAKLAPRRDYISEVKAFYAGARRLSSQLPYVVDLTHVLYGKEHMYEDSRHQTREGGTVLAEAIQKHCMEPGVFDTAGVDFIDPIGN